MNREIKAKNYEFYKRSHAVKTTVCSENPLNRIEKKLAQIKGTTHSSSTTVQQETTSSHPLGLSPVSEHPLGLGPLGPVHSNPVVFKSTKEDFLEKDLSILSSEASKKGQPSSIQAFGGSGSASAERLNKIISLCPELEKIISSATNDKDETEITEWAGFKRLYVDLFTVESLEGTIDDLLTKKASTAPAIISVSKGNSSYRYVTTRTKMFEKKNTISKRFFMQQLHALGAELVKHWKNEDKVRALKCTEGSIKIFKHKGDESFFPITFIYTTDIVETFKNLVMRRMKTLSYPNYNEKEIDALPDKLFIDSNIPESTVEIARNWVYKISAIKNVIPRIVINAGLLKLYFIAFKPKCKIHMMKLAQMMRGIGDLQTYAYVATYLIRSISELYPQEKAHILEIINHFIRLYSQKVAILEGDENFARIMKPFYEVTFRKYAESATSHELKELFSTIDQLGGHVVVLKHIFLYFPSEVVTPQLKKINKYIEQQPTTSKILIYSDYMQCLMKGNMDLNQKRETIKMIFEDFETINSFPVFMDLVGPFMELVIGLFDGYEKKEIFSRIIERFNRFFTNEKILEIMVNASDQKAMLTKLTEFLYKALRNILNLNEIVTLEPFLNLIQYFPSDLKSGVPKQILRILAEKNPRLKITDAFGVNTVVGLVKNLNDEFGAFKSLSTDQRIEISGLMIQFLKRVDFGRDLEEYLNIFTAIRANFGEFYELLEFIIFSTINLTYKAKRFSKGRYSPKITAFIQACLAFCYITIPSIHEEAKQVDLYFLTAQCGLIHNLVSQSESLMKNAISVLSELPDKIPGTTLDRFVTSRIKNMMSYLLVVPQNPEYEYLHLLDGVLSAIEGAIKWDPKKGVVYKISALTSCLVYLFVTKQERLPYHVDQVLSNDDLYKGPEYEKQIVEKIKEVLTSIYENIEKLGNLEPKDFREKEVSPLFFLDSKREKSMSFLLV